MPRSGCCGLKPEGRDGTYVGSRLEVNGCIFRAIGMRERSSQSREWWCRERRARTDASSEVRRVAPMAKTAASSALCRLLDSADTESCIPSRALRRHPQAIRLVPPESADARGRRNANRRAGACAQCTAPRSPVVRGLVPVGRRRFAPPCGRLPPARFGTGRSSRSATLGAPVLSTQRLRRHTCGAGAPPAGNRAGVGDPDATAGAGSAAVL